MAKKKPQRPTPGQASNTQAKREARAAQRAEEAARAEVLRKAAKRNERNIAIFKLSLIGLVVGGLIVVLFVVPYLRDKDKQERLENLDLEKIGTSPSAAGCAAVKTEKIVVPEEGWHVEPGTELEYDAAPPAYGEHWSEFLTTEQYRTIFTTKDRPPKEQLVHSLEHGHTVLWYDATLADDKTQYAALEEISRKVEVGDGLVIVPWVSEGEDVDGGAFPGGAHLALTHWTGSDPAEGVWQYCDGVSGKAVKSFILDYPKSDSPEPDAP